jgi:hypothetical protein
MSIAAFCALRLRRMLFTPANRPFVAGLSMGPTTLLDNLSMVAIQAVALQD